MEAKPNTPTITVKPDKPGIMDTVTLTGSAYAHPNNTAMKNAVWQVALDQEFKTILFSGGTGADVTSIDVPPYKIPADTAVYARTQYTDANDAASDYSPTVSFKLSAPSGLKRIFFEDFESTEPGLLPNGWKEINFNADMSGIDPNLARLTVWSVLTYDDLAAQGANRVTVPVMDGKSCYNESDRIDPYVEGHLFTPVINLTGITDVYLTFGSNYIQNQDNIGVLEYTTDGGTIDESGAVTGKWWPIAYLLDDQNKTADVKYKEDGSIDAEATFSGTADGTEFTYGDYVFAAQTGMTFDQLAPYISGRINDDTFESKRFEKYRLTNADNQAQVKIRWLNMGTGSWFWGIDNVAIWGNDGTGVNEWSLY